MTKQTNITNITKTTQTVIENIPTVPIAGIAGPNKRRRKIGSQQQNKSKIKTAASPELPEVESVEEEVEGQVLSQTVVY